MKSIHILNICKVAALNVIDSLGQVNLGLLISTLPLVTLPELCVLLIINNHCINDYLHFSALTQD